MIPRPVYTALWETLAADKRMVLLAGPRQAGKTTLAKAIAEGFPNRTYVNWDVLTDRARVMRDPYFFERIERQDASAPLVVFDEIHKWRKWKPYLKGAFDAYHDRFRFLVTGSGRLDLYRRGGDSLAGRYGLFRLWPLTLAELAGRRATLDALRAEPLAVAPDADGAAERTWRRLARVSGFPEPYARGDLPAYRRWSATYHAQVIREDIRDLTGLRSIGDVETLFALLPERVGRLCSLQALAEDLKVSYNTVKAWLEVLERFYLTFTLAPWTRTVVRATQKARKTYLLDYAGIEDPGARFENMVAVELLRAVHTWNDAGEGAFGLHYVRDKAKHEVDFLLTERRRPWLLIEAKRAETDVSPALARFQRQLGVPAIQLTDEGTGYRLLGRGREAVLVAPAWRWLPPTRSAIRESRIGNRKSGKIAWKRGRSSES